jgi:hypothetical protein
MSQSRRVSDSSKDGDGLGCIGWPELAIAKVITGRDDRWRDGIRYRGDRKPQAIHVIVRIRERFSNEQASCKWCAEI